MLISDWSSDVCSSDLCPAEPHLILTVAARQLGGERGGGRLRRQGGVEVDQAQSEVRDFGGDRPTETPQGRLQRMGTGCARGGQREPDPAAGEAECQIADRVEQPALAFQQRSEEHTSELPSLMRNSYSVFCLKKKNTTIS